MKSKFKNKGGWLFLLTLFLFVLIPLVVRAKGGVVVNEIFPNPEGSDKGKEFVELYNESDEKVNLDYWILRKISKKGSIKEYNFDSVLVLTLINNHSLIFIKFCSLFISLSLNFVDKYSSFINEFIKTGSFSNNVLMIFS